MVTRKKAREYVLQVLYACEVGGIDQKPYGLDFLKHKLLSSPNAFLFARELFLRTLKNQSEYQKMIQPYILNWDITRITVIDKLSLCIGICELLEFHDIPSNVSLNEAIELAKKYSTEKSGLFVNGVLDKIAKDIDKEKTE